MPLIEIDGQQLEVAPGATVMDAAHQAGIYIPHFCYHKKLSIAASCRMCLVEVEKAPKPLPACATPVTDGMKVMTRSPKAVTAQKGVMEFLLINHPLDCPICDQGGECQLQDIAVGYGGSASNYQEPKRVVKDKELGPLIATDMTRCIHCSRCVRFGQEIAGLMELGMPGRGEHTEVMPFLEAQVTHELSGNVIELCPVGALTSKPFRYAARSWELSRRKSVSPHDGLGANVQVHVKNGKVFRVVPQDNEAVNECWIADRDRYSYEALNSDQRLTRPMLKDGGTWREVSWQDALERVATRLAEIRASKGAAAIGGLASPHQTVEELYLFTKLLRGLGTENIDHRPAQAVDTQGQGARWLGMPVADLNNLERVLLIGATLRQEQPLIAQRLRQAVKRGAQLHVVHAADDNLLCKLAGKLIVKPSAWVNALARIAAALRDAGASVSLSTGDIQADDAARAIAASLMSGARKAVLLGAVAQNHPAANEIHALAQAIAAATGATLGFLSPAANSVGGQVVGTLPGPGGLAAAAMLGKPGVASIAAYVLLGVEPELEACDTAQARATLDGAEFVVLMSAFKTQAMDYADVLLPIAPFTETGGAFVNTEGRLQVFHGAVKPRGEARPAWKVLRVLGNLLSLGGFDYDSVEGVRADALPQGQDGIAAHLNNAAATVDLPGLNMAEGLERLGETPINQLDALTRRSAPLQATADAAAPRAWMCGDQLAGLNLNTGDAARIRQNGHEIVLPVDRDDRLAPGTVRIAAAHPLTAGLGARFGIISVEKA
ncbi:MAG: NADH-quinone oxidoreductase subunit G [Thiobacillaceae bacterium]|nr:NADH-quinone oxidoreductase subunit G [Hydrogenophilales bacterium]MBP9914655.1 NADH-quinone oxidoreductase subunit G [Thiobacillaceae bacterium]